jgi:hypothetical protein
MLHYLRIAVTALSLTACVLMVSLWVRSYYRLDTMRPWTGHAISCWRGRLFILSIDEKFLYGANVRPGDLQPTTIPILSLTLFAAGCAAAPWIGWSKRFSLRTLLVATTLVAVGLGGLVVLS